MEEKVKNKKASETFEEKIDNINKVIETLETKAIGIEESYLLYKKASDLIKDCKVIIDNIEGKVKMITLENNSIIEEEINVEN